MPIRLDGYGTNGPQFVWRWHRDWHLGWLPSELEALARGEPYPEHWQAGYRKWTEWAELDYFQVRHCWATGHDGHVQPLRWKTGTGKVAVFMTCTWCGERVSSEVGKVRLRAEGYEIDDLPLANPNRPNEVECERCGSADHVEWHHWAPYHLFDDADSWPKSNLCRACHQLWHRTVTPNMNQRKAW